MMIYFFNWLGFFFGLAGLLIGFIVDSLIKGQMNLDIETWNIVSMCAFGAMTFFLDFRYRLTHHLDKGKIRFIHPKTGGQLMFLPVWLVGTLVLMSLIGFLFDPNDYHVRVANGYLSKGNFSEAIKLCEEVISKDSTNERAHSMLGRVYLGEYDDLYKDYSKALYHNNVAYVSDTTNVFYLKNLAYNYFELSQYNMALPLYERLNLLRPKDPEAKSYLAICVLRTTEDFDRCKQLLEEAAALDTNYRKLVEEYLSGREK